MKVDVDLSFIKKEIDDVLNDKATRQEINKTFAEMCEPYVPMASGDLSSSVQILEDGIYYPKEYAHYMYEGQIYSPNIPITKNGEIVGWFSPRGQTKQPSGRLMNYSTDKHPLASREWDKAMMRDKGEEFTKKIEDILYRSLNGKR